MTPAGATRVLVCDESPAYAKSLARFLGAGRELEVVGVCATGEAAVEALGRLAPDLVTIDLELSGMGSVRAIAEIMRARPVPIVVVGDGAGRRSERTAEALAAGAVEALPKGILRLDDPDGAPALALRRRLVRVARSPGRTVAAGPPGGVAPQRPTRVIGVAASAGGPAALEVVLGRLPADFPVPVLVVQHITIGFVEGLVRDLDRRVGLPVRIADDGQKAGPGAWFAPDDAHLVLEPSMRLRLDGETAVGAHRPSADVLLESMAAVAGACAVGVVLTGMGRDGARGAGAIVGEGGTVIAQDEATSSVFGMPRAAAEAGAQTILPLERIADVLAGLTTAGATP